MNSFLEEIDWFIELFEQAHWTDYLMLIILYLIVLLGLGKGYKKNKRQLWYNYVWLLICPPAGIYLVKNNRKIRKKKKQTVIKVALTGWSIAICASLVYIGWIPKPTYSELESNEQAYLSKRENGGELSVHFIDIGQGDATLIVYDDFHILIDGGNNGSEVKLLSYLKEVKVDDLEILIATHPDADHIGGLAEVMREYSVDLIIDSGEAHTSQTYKDYANEVENQQLKGANYLEDNQLTFELSDDIQFQIIETGDNNGDRNNNSVVSKLSYHDIDFLFTGDMEEKVEKSILFEDLEADILKAGHHGSKTSSSRDFLNKVQPKTVVISAGMNNTYGHPHQALLERLERYTDDIYVTYESGTIVVTTDGFNYAVTQSIK